LYTAVSLRVLGLGAIFLVYETDFQHHWLQQKVLLVILLSPFLLESISGHAK